MLAEPTLPRLRIVTIGKILVVMIAIVSTKIIGHDAPLKAAPAPAFTGQPVANQPAPGLELKDVNGKTVKLSDYKGKVVVLNFWATWCPPCRKEIPGFIELQQQYGAKGLQFIGVALDEEGLGKVAPYLQQHPINYPVLIGDAKGTARYGDMNAIPVTFIIDRKGIIRQSLVGMREKSAIEAMLAPILAEKG